MDDSRPKRQIHYYEAFSLAPPSFTFTMTSVQEASECVSKSSDEDEDENEQELFESENLVPSIDLNVHRIFDLFTLVWCDPSVDETEENKEIQCKIRQSIPSLLTFTNIDDCQKYVERNQMEKAS